MSDSFHDGYGMTLDMQTAFTNGYIGEDAFCVKRLNNAMYYAWYGQRLPSVRYYYFGVADHRLREKFGIEPVRKEC